MRERMDAMSKLTLRIGIALFLLALAGAGPAWPQPPAGEEAALHERLRHPDPQVRALAEQGLWSLWNRSGDPAVDAQLERGVALMHAGSLADAIHVFSEIVRRRPDFAEAWNKRATAYYLAGEDDRSIADCREALKRNPRHFGALSGMGLLHARREDYAAALEWFHRALEVNPNMNGVRQSIRAIEELLRLRPERRT